MKVCIQWLLIPCRYMEEHKKLPQPPEGSRYAIYKDTI